MGGGLDTHSEPRIIHTLTRVDFHQAASLGNAKQKEQKKGKVSDIGSTARGENKEGGGGRRGLKTYFF